VRVAEWRVWSCFGFLPNLALSIHKNAQEVMGDTSLGCFFLKATNKAFHDLTRGKFLAPATTSLLGLSLKFIPTPRYAPSVTDIAPTLDPNEQEIEMKTFFSGCDQGVKIPILHAKSPWHPPLPPRQVDYWINNFLNGIRGLFQWHKGKQNLTPHQRQRLGSLQENELVIIANADKNVGPMGINVEHYTKLELDNLLDPSTYLFLTEDQADQDIHDLRLAIHAWTVCHRCSLPNDTVHFIREHMGKASKDSFGYFYLLIKLHKLPITGRPVCSGCGSLPHALGCYVDATLQPIVNDQALYFKNLADLKSDLKNQDLPPNASLLTCDAVAMYPSIDTADCLARLSENLSDPEVSTMYGFSSVALPEALELVMFNNCMRFGDVIVKQISRIAMGMSPAPTIANLYEQSMKKSMC
jgi:hypothetical protein